MPKIAIIGAGVSGLTIAQLLKKNYEVTVFEKESSPGGMIRCQRVDGHLFHLTGGHVFNTKRKDVLDWFWGNFNRDKEFIKADRYSVVSLENNKIITYPIENHAYQFPEDMMKSFIKDLIYMSGNKPKEPENFEEFLKSRFGETLYNEYFKPYNEKIWRCSLTNVPLSWLEGKLPMPTLEEILYNNFNHIEEKQFVHSSFYYPLNNGSQFIADRLSEGINIRYNTNIISICKRINGWDINGEYYEKVIFSGNIKQIPELIKGLDLSIFFRDINELEAHGTTSVLCEIDNNPYSWIYLPSKSHMAHRIICTGNFAKSNRSNNKMSAIIEFTDYISKEDILKNLSRIPYKPQYLAHNFCKYTYPIQGPKTREFIKRVKDEVEKSNLYLLGRFAEWEYYNMDAAIGAAIDLSNRLLKNL